MRKYNGQTLNLDMVDGNTFGRYPYCSSAETYNMIISEGCLVPFAGYRRIAEINNTGQGRAIYSSSKQNKMYCVIDNDVFSFDVSLSRKFIGRLETFTGDVFISENNANQIALCDKQNIYIIDAETDGFETYTEDDLGFKPGYIDFQDSYFISTNLNNNQWRISDSNNGRVWPFDEQHVGEVSTKPGNAVAALRIPGKGNNLLVFGQNVAEIWTDVGSKLFPYQRNQSRNIDYGCINPASIARLEDKICWVAKNEDSGIAIFTYGAEGATRISNDGIDFKLARFKEPQNCYGYMVRLDGHLCYIATWPEDRTSYLYDFNSNKFSTLCDENMNAYIAKNVVFFNNKYYFVSIIDGNLYEISSSNPVYDYGNGDINQVQMIRVCDNIKLPNNNQFICDWLTIFVQQGTFDFNQGDIDNVARIDVSISQDGGQTFGNYVGIPLNAIALRKGMVKINNIGIANDLTFQFRFQGYGAYVVSGASIGVRTW